MKKLSSYDDIYYYKILKYLKRKPRNKMEAQEAVDRIYPGAGMQIYWGKREIGKYEWSGKIKNPILKKKISSGHCRGYDLAHGLMSWVFNRQHKGSGGIAGTIYGCISGEPISHRQEMRLKRMLS